jgi:hypothetical protein
MAKALLFTSPDQTPVLQALTKAHIKTYTRKDGVTVKAHDTRIEAHGVKGMKSTPWRKVFKSPEHFEQWSEKDGGDHQVLGYRELAEPAAAGADLPVASKVPAAVKTVTDLLGGEEWTHSEGSSHNPHGRRSGSRGLATDEALVANGFAATGSTDDSDTFTHPEGHVAVNTQHGITITHAKEAKEAPAPSLAASSVTVDGEDRYEFAHGKKPGGKGGTYMFSPQKSHDFGSGSSVAGEDYFQSAYGAGYSESKAAAKKWAAGKGHSRIHVQT